jgi:hypothetical protein
MPETRLTDTNRPPNFPDVESNGKHLVYLHGYNVSELAARGNVAQMFKRLWQSRSRAMFTGVLWYGNQGAIPAIGYYDDVRNAFLTGPSLATAVAGLPGASKVVAAHSLGNVAVSSAIVDHRLAVEQYFAIDAAVAMEAYDGSLQNLDPACDMIYPNTGGIGFEGWQAYDQRLWAATWYTNFPSGDGRNGLTWSNRFGAISNLYNFYSTGEEVLENPPVPRQLHIDLFWITDCAWMNQEMLKGTGLADLLSSIGLVDAHAEGGWGLNTSHTGAGGWYVPVDPDHLNLNWRPRYHNETYRADTSDWTHISQPDLLIVPFFNPFRDALIFDAQLGSSEAARIDTRGEVLGSAIPALSHATWANSVSAFVTQAGDRNLNMMSMETGWPYSRTSNNKLLTRWLHGDFKDVAYPFNQSLHNNIVAIGGLDK